MNLPPPPPFGQCTKERLFLLLMSSLTFAPQRRTWAWAARAGGWRTGGRRTPFSRPGRPSVCPIAYSLCLLQVYNANQRLMSYHDNFDVRLMAFPHIYCLLLSVYCPLCMHMAPSANKCDAHSCQQVLEQFSAHPSSVPSVCKYEPSGLVDGSKGLKTIVQGGRDSV